MGNIRNFLESVKVYDCLNLVKIRIGNSYDGGYVAYKEICEETKHVYCFGIGNDVGFELDWVKRFPNSNIELFDPLIDGIPEEHKRFTFHRYGIGGKYNAGIFEDVERNSLLKLDIEWDEWSTLLNMEQDKLEKFSQILVEFHIIHATVDHVNLSPYFSNIYQEVINKINQDLFAMYYSVMQRLSNHYRLFHIHANNSLPMIFVNNYRFPPLLEMSFIRKDLVGTYCLTMTSFPIIGLDYPNKTDRPDITDFYPLWRWNAGKIETNT